MKRTLIDTRLWVLALKRAVYEQGTEEHELGTRAQQVIEACLEHDHILLSGQLLSEVYAVATGRGRRITPTVVRGYIDTILSAPRARFLGTHADHYLEAIDRSSRSGIHIWDFLVVLPFRDSLDRIVTMDPHFRDPIFGDIATIENPMGVWKVEGQR